MRVLYEVPRAAVQGGHVQQFSGLGGVPPGHDHLAAVLLDALVAAEQERQKHRADVIDLAQVEDEPGGRIRPERGKHQLRRLLHLVFRHLLDFGRRRDDGNVAMPLDHRKAGYLGSVRPWWSHPRDSFSAFQAIHARPDIQVATPASERISSRAPARSEREKDFEEEKGRKRRGKKGAKTPSSFLSASQPGGFAPASPPPASTSMFGTMGTFRSTLTVSFV